MTYTPAEIILIAGSIGTTITGMFVAIITAWRTSAKVDANIVKTQLVVEKVEEVHKLTNKNYSEQVAISHQQAQEINQLRREMETMRILAAKQEVTRSQLATDVARNVPPPGPDASIKP